MHAHPAVEFVVPHIDKMCEVRGAELVPRLLRELVMLLAGIDARFTADAEIDIVKKGFHVRDLPDHALLESFFSSLKKELVHLMTFHSKDQARRAIFEYIEIFYNRQRRHSALNQKSPLEYYQDVTQAL
jgi:hypothetical protein